MHPTTVAVDLAKHVVQVGVANAHGRVIARLNRTGNLRERIE